MAFPLKPHSGQKVPRGFVAGRNLNRQELGVVTRRGGRRGPEELLSLDPPGGVVVVDYRLSILGKTAHQLLLQKQKTGYLAAVLRDEQIKFVKGQTG